MLLLFAGGVMNLYVIAALTVFVAFEKLAPLGNTERGPAASSWQRRNLDHRALIAFLVTTCTPLFLLEEKQWSAG